MAKERGKFIVFEGGEGVGKSTQLARLAVRLRESGYDVLTTREPGGTGFGTGLRKILGSNELAPYEELALFLADRSYHIRTLIKPALDEGKMVLCDRFSDSTIAYQSYGGNYPQEVVRKWDAEARCGVKPDLVIFLDMPPNLGLERISKSRASTTVFEDRDIEYHERVRRGFIHIADTERENHVVVDAKAEIDDVDENIAKGVKNRLGINITRQL